MPIAANKSVFEKRIESLQEFITRHTGTMNGIFLLLYSLEQALLVIFTAIYPLHIMFVISLFVIVAFFTFGIEKVLLEKKNRHLEEELYKLKYERGMLIAAIAKYKAIAESMTEGAEEKDIERLKKGKSLNNKKVRDND